MRLIKLFVEGQESVKVGRFFLSEERSYVELDE